MERVIVSLRSLTRLGASLHRDAFGVVGRQKFGAGELAVCEDEFPAEVHGVLDAAVEALATGW